jgi:hypothetical protein
MKAQDLHSLQTIANASAVSTTAVFTLLNGIAQGDDIGSRESNDVLMTSVSGIIQLQCADATNVFRTLIVWDKQPNGLTPTQADLIQGSNTADVSEPLKAQRKDFYKRFKILYDKVNSLNLVSQVNKVLRFRIPLHRQSKYSGGGSTIASIATGALWLVQISDSTIGPSTPASSFAITSNWKG